MKRQSPPPMLRWIAGASCVAAAALLPVRVAGAEPAPATRDGRTLYTSFCARCHGLNMVNTGGATFDLRKFPKDQHERFVRSVTQGLRAMPAWGSIFKPEEVEALWQYVSAGSGS